MAGSELSHRYFGYRKPSEALLQILPGMVDDHHTNLWKVLNTERHCCSLSTTEVSLDVDRGAQDVPCVE